MANSPVQRRPIWRRVIGRVTLSSQASDGSPRLLTRGDQRAIALLIALSLVAITSSWLASGGHEGGLVAIDTAEPLEAKFATDINTAEWNELSQLPGIGEALAKRIVEWRKREGPFTSLDELDGVPGIGPKTLDQIRPYLRPIR